MASPYLPKLKLGAWSGEPVMPDRPQLAWLTIPHPSNHQLVASSADTESYLLLPDNDLLTVSFDPHPPHLGCSLDDVGRVRAWLERQADANTSVVDVKVIGWKGLRCVKSVVKHRASPPVYIATLIIPFAAFSFTVQIQATDEIWRGDDFRAKMIRSRLVHTPIPAKDRSLSMVHPEHPLETLGAIIPKHSSALVGTTLSDPSIRWADDERYDALFVEHPLSRVRQHMTRVLETSKPSLGMKKARQ
ncbi:hypothetical protein BZG36_03938 [Bifiguratus adelaidae]|uniref:Uncharacterized protein n=1 Tax=Bifiguratus adelaidae TaxID=1938954 RepID=A0A261XZV2_9FUNG|nr:hypothetical protein BZG36_03938 [Bifiguratus adelaidae]